MPRIRSHPVLVSVLTLALGLGSGACATTQPFAGMTAQEVFDASVEYLEEEQWDRAIDGFERVLFSFPQFPGAAQARIHLADAFFGKEQYLSAAAEYQRALDRHPAHELAPVASLGVCRSHAALSPIAPRDQEYTRQAVQSCGNVATDFPGSDQARRALEIRGEMVGKLAEKDYLRGKYYLDRGFHDSALIWFQDVVERYPETPAAPRSLLRMYEAYLEIGYSEDAAETRARLLSEYPDSEAARELQRNANGDEERAT